MVGISPSLGQDELVTAREMAREIGGDLLEIPTLEMQRPGYRANAGDRCYHCKSELFDTMDRLGAELGFATTCYGVNTDDTGDFRPGHRAADEHGVLSPFLDAGLSKQEIRSLSRAAGLPSADLPASACLSSRLPTLLRTFLRFGPPLRNAVQLYMLFVVCAPPTSQAIGGRHCS